MSNYDEHQILDAFDKNLCEAKSHLARLAFCCGRTPTFQGLSGWVFEQTIQLYLRNEVEDVGIKAQFSEQISLGGYVKADLLVGTIALELKVRGLMDSKSAARYGKYRLAAEAKSYSYLYVTLQETYLPYQAGMRQSLGEQNAFFLDIEGDWNRLTERVIHLLKQS